MFQWIKKVIDKVLRSNGMEGFQLCINAGAFLQKLLVHFCNLKS